MPVAPDNIWSVLYTVSRYLFPLLACSLVFLVLFYILSESAARRERIRHLPGSGTVGEMIVLSGGRDLDANTWFPVPREGVLGSIRSCDLVIPCPGVHTKHLDFSWQDGKGLLIRPRTGCEVLVNGTPVTCRTDASAVPLTHGALLQVGSAVLRLHLFAALDNSVSPVQQVPAGTPVYPDMPVPVSCDMPGMPPQYAPFPQQAPGMQESFPPAAGPAQYFSPVQSPVEPFSPDPSLQAENPDIPETPPEAQPARVRRSDRWKEDLGE